MAQIGILPLARPNFDVPFAEEVAAKAFATLEKTGHTLVGPRALLFDAQAAEAALTDLNDAAPDLVLLLQVTFTDASMTARIAASVAAPLAIWAFPEPRAGGRLRLNSFCGLNLAAHSLGLAQREFGYLYSAPDAAGAVDALNEILAGGRRAEPVAPVAAKAANGDGAEIVARVRGARIGRLGEHPVGFDTCAYDDARLRDSPIFPSSRSTLDAPLRSRARRAGSDGRGGARDRTIGCRWH